MSKERLENSKHFCMAPWTHVHAWAGGEVYACCMSNVGAEHELGNLNDTKLDQILNTDEAKQLRKNMLDDVPSKQCTRCYEQESYGFSSLRQNMNKDNIHHYDLVENTKADGTINELRITYWDMRFSNNCNMKCRSCGDKFSTMWFDDNVAIWGEGYKTHHKKVLKVRDDFNSLLEEAKPQIKNLERMYFAGGEPLIMPEMWSFVDEIIKQGKTNADIYYQTNMSQLTYKKRNAIDIWNQLERVTVMASIDAYGERAEYIRAGQPWNKVENNLRLTRQQCPDVNVFASCTVGIQNIDHVVDLHKHLFENNLVDIDKFGLNPVFHPYHYRVEVAPPKRVQQAKQKIDEHIEYLESLDEKLIYTIPQFKSYRKMLDNESLHQEHWQTYVNTTRTLDRVRKQSVDYYLPDLAEYMNDQ